MLALVLSILITVVTCLVSVAELRFDTRRKGGRTLTRVGRGVLAGQLTVLVLAVALTLTQVLQERAQALRATVIDEWARVPITGLTLGIQIEPDRLKDYGREQLNPIVQLQIGVDFGPLLDAPPVDVSDALERLGTFEAARVRVDGLLPALPDKIGDLVGHAIKVRENDIRPFTVVRAVNFYATPDAKQAFLTLSERAHEYVGGYYMRVWYPEHVRRLRTLRESHMNHGPFVVLAELMPATSPFE